MNDIRLGNNGKLSGPSTSTISGLTLSERLIVEAPNNGSYTFEYLGKVEDLEVNMLGGGTQTVILTQPLQVADSLLLSNLTSISTVGVGRQIRVSGNVINNADVGGNGPISLRRNGIQTLSGTGTLANLDVNQGPLGETLLLNDILLGNGGALTSSPERSFEVPQVLSV